MKMLTSRAYAGLSDLRAMQAVLSAGAAAGTRAFYVHPGDLSWWLFYIDATTPHAECIWMWEWDGAVIGWTLFTVAEGLFDLFVTPDWLTRPEYAEMHAASAQELAARVRAHGGDRVGVMWVAEDDNPRLALLADAGFRRCGPEAGLDFVCFGQALVAERAEVVAPAGCTIREVAGEHEIEARARPQAAAFKTRLSWPDYLARYRRFMQSPIYADAHDTGLVLADGTFAAVTIWWVDPVNRIGHFEPVATHPDLHRRGYGRTLLRTCLNRMRATGLVGATVCTGAESHDNIAFYHACGFDITHRLIAFQRALDEPFGRAQGT